MKILSQVLNLYFILYVRFDPLVKPRSCREHRLLELFCQTIVRLLIELFFFYFQYRLYGTGTGFIRIVPSTE